MIRKSQASLEVWGKLTGSIDTPEKFEAKRMQLATHEWDRMKASNSRECRNCHNTAKMSTELQSAKAQARHAKMASEGLTCIDCHFGIAHNEPAGPGPRDIDFKTGKAL